MPENFWEAIRSESEKWQEIMTYRKYGRNYCGRLFDRETAEGALTHVEGGGCLCTYIEKLDAECITWPLLVLMVYQLRYGKYFVRRKIGVVGLKVWRVCWKCGEFVKSVNNLLKMWRICWKCEQIIESVRSLLNVWRICWKSEEFVESVKNLLKVWRIYWKCEEFDESVKNLLKVWRVCCKCEEFVVSVKNLLKVWRIWWKCEEFDESVKNLLKMWSVCCKCEEFVESVKNLLKKIINRKDFSENSKMTWGCTVYTGKEKRGVRNSSIYRRIFLLSVLAIFKPIHWLVNWVCSDR